MLRPFLSLLVAAGATVAGAAMAWSGAGHRMFSLATFQPEPDVAATLASVVGILVLGGAAASLAIHWVGVLVVGFVHAVLGALAVIVPPGNLFSGNVFSPVLHITRMLSAVDRPLSESASMFYLSGAALVVGAFLVAAALGVRSRRLAAPAGTSAAALSSVLGGVALLAATGLVLFAGGDFTRGIFQMMRYDGGLAALLVVAGVLAGVGGLLLRWSSMGAIVVGLLVTIAGFYLYLAAPAFVWASPVRLPALYGMVATLGVTVLAGAFGGWLRPPPSAYEGDDDGPEAL